MSFIQEVIGKWVTDGIGVSTGATRNILWGLKGTVPPGGGPFIVIVETGGMAPLRTQNTFYQRPSAQCIAIAQTVTQARALAKSMYDSLQGVRNQMLSGTWYLSINPNQEPFDFPLDAAGRPRSGFNISAVKAPS